MVARLGGTLSGCHRAASILDPSIALIARNFSEAPGRGCISSGKPAGRGTASNSMLAATCAAPAGDAQFTAATKRNNPTCGSREWECNFIGASLRATLEPCLTRWTDCRFPPIFRGDVAEQQQWPILSLVLPRVLPMAPVNYHGLRGTWGKAWSCDNCPRWPAAARAAARALGRRPMRRCRIADVFTRT